MKIGVDLGHVVEGETGGVVPYLQGLLEALFAGWPRHEIVVFGTSANEHLLPAPPAHVRRLTLDANDYHLLLDACAAALRLDVLFRGYPSEAELTYPRARQVVLVPDCQHEFFPDFFDPETLRGRRAAFRAALQGAGAIATLSEHAQRTILSHPDARDPDVFVSSPALRGRLTPPAADGLTAEEQALLPRGDFFIYPANLWPHKNHPRVLDAFERFLRRSSRPVEFVFTGHPRGWDELRARHPGLPIRHLGFVRREFLQVLLARARALVFFSLFEGFGMPLLEAFAAGTPVACSDTTSLPEVGGSAVLDCDPTDVAAMSACLERVHADEGLRARLVARGRDRLAGYNWHDSAACLVDACERVHARAAGAWPDPLPVLQRVAHLVREIQADRAARLDVMHALERDLRQSLADGTALRSAVQQLEEAVRRGEGERAALNEDRRALHAAVQRLEAELREPLVKRGLRACKLALARPFRRAPR